MNAKQHWLMQKVSSIAMIPLCVWFALLLTKLASMDHSNFIDWLSAPTNTYFAIALLPVMFLHISLGLQVILEDYIYIEKTRNTYILLINTACFLLTFFGLLSIITIAYK
jgi:succinate dehydrogenase / fumarate reductase membrane anchor subunit